MKKTKFTFIIKVLFVAVLTFAFASEVKAADTCECSLNITGTHGDYQALNYGFVTAQSVDFDRISEEEQGRILNCSFDLPNLFILEEGVGKKINDLLTIESVLTRASSIASSGLCAPIHSDTEEFDNDYVPIKLNELDQCSGLEGSEHSLKYSPNGKVLIAGVGEVTIPVPAFYKVTFQNCQVKKDAVTSASPTTTTPTKPTKPATTGAEIPDISVLNKVGGGLTIQTFIGRVLKGIIQFIGSIAFVMYIYGGFLWMTSAGNSSKQDKAKKILVWTTLGIFVILSSYILVDFLFRGFR